MGATIDDLVPAEVVILTPTLRRDQDGRIILTVVAGGSHRRLVLDSDKAAALIGDIMRLALILDSELSVARHVVS